MDNFDLKKYLAENKLYEDAKKQTVVEWLVEQLNLYEYEDVIKQAKEMEKQQIIDAYNSGWKRANDTKDSAISTAEDHGEYYYNKLFN
jgi:hypothetical protein